jgi:DNA-binding response OmpR family regulator
MTTSSDSALDGLKVLVVEDEALIAMDLGATLRRAGCRVVGPAPGIEQALRTIAAEEADVALLDVNLGGEEIFPVADELARRGIPFVFLTGYGRDALPERFRDRPTSPKPYSAKPLLAKLAAVAGRGP